MNVGRRGSAKNIIEKFNKVAEINQDKLDKYLHLLLSQSFFI